MSRLLLVVLCIASFSCTTGSRGPAHMSDYFAVDRLPVFYAAAHPELHVHAERIAAHLTTAPPMPINRNPTCCIWLDLTGWSPNPGTNGYIILVQPGGIKIEGSSIQQVALAVEHLIETLEQSEGKVSRGILTNYNLIE